MLVSDYAVHPDRTVDDLDASKSAAADRYAYASARSIPWLYPRKQSALTTAPHGDVPIGDLAVLRGIEFEQPDRIQELSGTRLKARLRSPACRR